MTSITMEVLLEANRVLKRQAEERHVIYCQLVEYSRNNSEKLGPELTEMLEEHLAEPVESDYFKTQKLIALNNLIGQIDQKEAERDLLLTNIRESEENIKSRNELITILQQYIDMEEASIYRLVEEYNEAQEALEQAKESGKIFETLSSNDPRMKALQTIQDHEQGISLIQLSFMLGTTQYNANKIINELIDMNLITRKDQLIKVGDNRENVENQLLNVAV